MTEAGPWKLPAKITLFSLLLPSERWKKSSHRLVIKPDFQHIWRAPHEGPAWAKVLRYLHVSLCLSSISAAVYLIQTQAQLDQWPPQAIIVLFPNPWHNREHNRLINRLPTVSVPSSASDWGSRSEEFSCSFCTPVCHLKVGIVPFSFRYKFAIIHPCSAPDTSTLQVFTQLHKAGAFLAVSPIAQLVLHTQQQDVSSTHLPMTVPSWSSTLPPFVIF